MNKQEIKNLKSLLMAASKSGIFPKQLLVLMILEDNGEPLAMKDISAQCGSSRAALTGSINRMFDLGLVSRCHAKTDRRRVMVSVTDKGKVTLQVILNTLLLSPEVE